MTARVILRCHGCNVQMLRVDEQPEAAAGDHPWPTEHGTVDAPMFVKVDRCGHHRSGGARYGPAPPASSVLRIAVRPPSAALDPGASAGP